MGEDQLTKANNTATNTIRKLEDQLRKAGKSRISSQISKDTEGFQSQKEDENKLLKSSENSDYISHLYESCRSGNIDQLQELLPFCPSEEVKHRCLHHAIDYKQ